MTSTLYDAKFYAGQDNGSLRSACVIVPLVMDIVRPNSVLDVGCGTGTWLGAFAEAGVTDFLGVDGDYVGRDQLRIPADHFRPMDLATTPNVGRTYDLAACLEVAEHLPQHVSHNLVGMLTTAASAVLFSAALPGQGGTHHINEQWPWYWKELFERRGYVRLDPFRRAIWQNSDVAVYYQQNLYLFVDPKVHPGLIARFGVPDKLSELTLVKTTILQEMTRSSIFRRGMRKIARLFGAR